MTDSDFLPEGYEAPQSEKRYMRFEDGENRFRILSSPLIGWLDWKDNKPMRFKHDSKPSEPIDPKKPIKHFWALIVWNYQQKAIQILEITQQTVFGKIQNLAKDQDWGDPREYDIKVTKSGQALDTKYDTNPCPKETLSVEIAEELSKVSPDLEKLWLNQDPFEDSKE